jgi:hypothetical protein
MVGVGASLGSQLASAADPIIGYDSSTDAPDNAFSFDIEGCRLDKSSEVTYDPPGTLVCDSGATWPDVSDSYTDGNLGKQWEELDLVPHRIGSNSAGLTTASDTFKIVIGADNLINEAPAEVKIGYDLIAEFVLNEGLSTGSAAECVYSLVGGNQIGDFGIGGADNQIVQVIEITQAADVRCVFDYVEQLAITSSKISGSSNQSYIVAGTGAQTVPIPSDIQPQELAKTMGAVEDSTVSWSLEKDADPVNFDFGNTCDPQVPLTKDVNVTITVNRGETTLDSLTATSMVTATNPSSRDVTYSCTDELYGTPEGGSETLLDTQYLDEVVEAGQEGGMETFDIVHEIDGGTRGLRNELTCEIKVEDLLNPGQFILVGSLDASFSLPDGDIAPGTTVNDMVAVSDTESITGTGFEFSTDDPTGATGSFDGYTQNTSTTGPVDWTSDPISSTVNIVFTKTISVDPWIETTGSLNDNASINLSDSVTLEASSSTSLSSDPVVELTIQKTIPDILQIGETIACNFNVTNNSGYDKDVVINFGPGETDNEATLSELDPDVYMVSEGSCGGLIPEGGTNQQVDLSLVNAVSYDACSGNATYINTVGAGGAIAEVNKITMPAGFEDGWSMTLKGPGLPAEGITLDTADGDSLGYETFDDPVTGQPFVLQEGDYAITEAVLAGWEQASSSGCSFSVNYPADLGKTFQCDFTNKKLGRVIIEKQTDPDGTTDLFTFTQDVDASGNFQLADNGSEIFTGVSANDPGSPYQVTESDPAPEYDLTDLSCTDDFDGNGYNINDSFVGAAAASINVDPGETVKCVYTNTKRGMVEVLKLTNGAENPNMAWDFTLSGPDVNASDSTLVPDPSDPGQLIYENPLDFGPAKLIPGETYTLCEVGIPPTWSSSWSVDTDGDGVADTIIPFVAGVNNDLVDPITGYSRVYDPNYVPPPDVYSNDTRCVNFVVHVDETLVFEVDNTRPGGEPRTIGYWKNWNTCSGGNQQFTAAENGGAAEGWWLLDDLLNSPGYILGSLVLDGDPANDAETHEGLTDCEAAVEILDKSDMDGRKRASDPAYNMAAQLLGALLNLSAGAETCDAAVDAAAAGLALLNSSGFDGYGVELKSKGKKADLEGAEANELAGILDEYNNGFLCD